MSGGPEWSEVERPFLDQLASMGWKVVIGNLDEPSVTGRESFREVLMKQDLRKAIAKINLRDGEPWLDDARLSQAVSALERIGHKKLMEANQDATELLLGGVQVEGLPGWDGGRARTIHFIDWEHPENKTRSSSWSRDKDRPTRHLGVPPWEALTPGGPHSFLAFPDGPVRSYSFGGAANELFVP